MGHSIQGIVAQIDYLRDIAPAVASNAVIASLKQSFGLLLPSERSYHSEIVPVELDELALKLSGSGAVAAIATDYFGGSGFQRCGLWDHSRCLVKPEWAESGSPISDALARMGVVKGDAYDEFDAVGLGRYRENADWMIYAEHGEISFQQLLELRQRRRTS